MRSLSCNVSDKQSGYRYHVDGLVDVQRTIIYYLVVLVGMVMIDVAPAGNMSAFCLMALVSETTLPLATCIGSLEKVLIVDTHGEAGLVDAITDTEPVHQVCLLAALDCFS